MTTEAIIVPPPVIPETPPATPPANTPAPPAPPQTTPTTPPADAPIGFDTTPPPAAPPPPQDNVVVYEKTGDTSLDVALRYIGERGFGPDHPAVAAAQAGDFSKIEQALGSLGDKAKGFKEYVDLAKDAFGRRQAAAKSQGEAAAKAVYDAVGGKEQWAAIQAWAAQHADADEKAQLNAAFKAGGLAATSAATYLRDLYKVHGKTAPKSAVKPDASAAGGGDSSPLDARSYGREVAKLRAKLGTRFEASTEYATLKSRFAASRG